MPKRYKNCNCTDTKMPGADTFTESLFTIQHLADFVPENHSLRRIRVMVKAALLKMDALFSGMYWADIRGGRLIEHDAVIELFKPVLEMASQQDLLLGENTSAWTSRSSRLGLVRKALCEKGGSDLRHVSHLLQTTSSKPVASTACTRRSKQAYRVK